MHTLALCHPFAFELARLHQLPKDTYRKNVCNNESIFNKTVNSPHTQDFIEETNCKLKFLVSLSYVMNDKLNIYSAKEQIKTL